jgi:hypothetical protein
MSCSFGSLAESPCPDPVVWETSSGSRWCDKHKPTWTESKRVSNKSDDSMIFVGRVYGFSGRQKAGASL